jgi:hypothetical protein
MAKTIVGNGAGGYLGLLAVSCKGVNKGNVEANTDKYDPFV